MLLFFKYLLQRIYDIRGSGIITAYKALQTKRSSTGISMKFYQQSTIFGNPCLNLSMHRTRFTIEQDEVENGVGVKTPFVS